jgi:2-polyprenyl-3-methyl-5-hydroxy-6-metoxy-1,4-benzoquinol methylase
MVEKMDMKVELYENIYVKRFSFGKNWNAFLKKLDDRKIKLAKQSLLNFTGLKSFKNKIFIDVGCGSGLFSLSAALLNAKKVISFDVDKNSIGCTRYLRKKYGIENSRWTIIEGSALDKKFLNGLEKADLVYSWGVLHHTGDMWAALENVAKLVKKGGLLYIAIYNKFEGFPIKSRTWRHIKKFYSGRGRIIRKVMEILYVTYYVLGVLANGKSPVKYIRNYSKSSVRGMNFFIDAKDWLGGYPYEFASEEEINRFFFSRKLRLIKVKKTKREGCNEFLFKKQSSHRIIRIIKPINSKYGMLRQ